MSPGQKRALIVLISLLASLLLLEGVLQGIAWWNWARIDAERRAESRTGEKTILCVGDSFTHGIGASDRSRSYPRVLWSKLEQSTPGGFAVLNRGYPGFDSSDILRRLTRQLRTLRPDYVYVLIGYNDRFSVQPEVLATELEADTAPDGFRWRCRTLDLFRRIGIGLSGADPVRSYPKEICGLWHSDSVEVSFHEDGHMVMNGVPSRWYVLGEELRVGEAAKESSVRWRRETGRLILEGDILETGRIELERGPGKEDPLAAARLAIRDGRLEAAALLLKDCKPGPLTLGARAELSSRVGEKSRFQTRLQELRTLAVGDAAARGELARVLIVAGQSDEGLQLARSYLAEHPVHRELWTALTDLAGREPRRLAAVVDIVDAMLAAIDDKRLRGMVLSQRAGMVRHLGGDPVAVLKDYLESGLLLDHLNASIALLRSDPQVFNEEVIAKAKASLELSPKQRDMVEGAIREARAGANSASGRLERHLRKYAEMCRQHGARLVLLLYPEPIGLEPAVRRVCQAGLAALVDPQPRFAEELQRRNWSELFASDGHCNDAGYALLAEIVCADLQTRAR